MLIQKNNNILSSEITSESQYLKRREFLKAGAVMGAGSAIATAFPAAALQTGNNVRQYSAPDWLQRKIVGSVSAPGKPHVFHAQDALTPYEAVASYNNFYEFGTDKSDPAQNSASFITDPWEVNVSGEAESTGRYNLEDLLAQVDIEERVYRLRCVEAWSMVVPWLGFPLASLLQRFKPTSKARYVEFKTLLDKRQMPGQKSRTSVIKWPYVEGLRIDEAMHPLTFVAIGLYGKSLPPQNGAPLRLVVPWKYGFKSIKSIVSIKFTSRPPRTSWQSIAPREYGFYANVNPKVNHPRWSQAVERRLPSSLFSPNRVSTQLFNGYGEQVASLYQGMNLRRFY